MEIRFKGQRLGNVGLNIDEKKRNKEEKRRGGSHGPSAGRVHAVAAVFFTKFDLREKKRKGWLGLAYLREKKKTMGRQKLLYCA